MWTFRLLKKAASGQQNRALGWIFSFLPLSLSPPSLVPAILLGVSAEDTQLAMPKGTEPPSRRSRSVLWVLAARYSRMDARWIEMQQEV